ncbi:MAG: hypothetical protein SGJ02_11055, partial [bacterium]|nr:hypothetical protein [bacterium]
MRKLNLKNIVLAGLVGLFFSANAYAAPVPNPFDSILSATGSSLNYGECEVTPPGSGTSNLDCSLSGADQAWQSAFLENMNSQFSGVVCTPSSPVSYANYGHNATAAISNAYVMDYINPATGNVI